MVYWLHNPRIVSIILVQVFSLSNITLSGLLKIQRFLFLRLKRIQITIALRISSLLLMRKRKVEPFRILIGSFLVIIWFLFLKNLYLLNTLLANNYRRKRTFSIVKIADVWWWWPRLIVSFNVLNRFVSTNLILFLYIFLLFLDLFHDHGQFEICR